MRAIKRSTDLVENTEDSLEISKRFLKWRMYLSVIWRNVERRKLLRISGVNRKAIGNDFEGIRGTY